MLCACASSTSRHHPVEGRHRLVLHRLGQEPFTSPADRLHHRQVGRQRRGRAGRPARSRSRASACPTSANSRSTGTPAWVELGDAPRGRNATPRSSRDAPDARDRRRVRRLGRPRPRQADHGLRHRQDLHRAEDRRAPSPPRMATRPRPVPGARPSRCCPRRCASGPPRPSATMRRLRRLLGHQGRQAEPGDIEDIPPTTCPSRPPPTRPRCATEMDHRERPRD